MKIMVSACLLGENCKYNGGNNFSEKVAEFIKGHEVIPVCPEVMGGLPTPRVPSEIVRRETERGEIEGASYSTDSGLVTNREGVVVDKEFRAGAQAALETAERQQIDMAILQSRSPSCGVKEIYDGTFSKTLIPGSGIFAEMLIQKGFNVVDVEDIEI